MVDRHVMVEINLSSNEAISWAWRGMRIRSPCITRCMCPVALSTDDEGVSRIDLTHEYVRAAIDYGLTYRDLKQLARTGMEHELSARRELVGQAGRFSTDGLRRAHALIFEKLPTRTKAILALPKKELAKVIRERKKVLAAKAKAPSRPSKAAATSRPARSRLKKTR
jgi:hypothetical protein